MKLLKIMLVLNTGNLNSGTLCHDTYYTSKYTNFKIKLPNDAEEPV